MGVKLGTKFREVIAKRKFKRMNTTDIDISTAMNILRKSMEDDDAYAYGWHANIAMAMYDSMPETFWMPDRSKHHKIANEGASRFMKLAFDVKTSANMLEDNDE